MLGTSWVEGSKICPRDFLGIGQGFKDKSPVQNTGEGSQRVKRQEKEKRLDWYGNVQEYRGDLA